MYGDGEVRNAKTLPVLSGSHEDELWHSYSTTMIRPRRCVLSGSIKQTGSSIEQRGLLTSSSGPLQVLNPLISSACLTRPEFKCGEPLEDQY